MILSIVYFIETEWRIYAFVNWAIIGSDNALSLIGHPAIIWTNDVLLGKRFQWNLNKNTLFTQENCVENVDCKMSAICVASVW